MLDYRTEAATWDGRAAEVYGGVKETVVRAEGPETVTVLGPADKLPDTHVRVRRTNGEELTVERSSLSPKRD